ncbi:Lysine-specific demethylase 5D [Orchesella cincta]|uniref:[histone H3]-trimethyl-L-lysine(4) demethylase n=1 Tax=Orchesella cincta TaxID=48709 RepID=A0A1D2MNG8_ORCCI|nr:Lysine-specific demethylase 5D [Orchesella cincta]
MSDSLAVNAVNGKMMGKMSGDAFQFVRPAEAPIFYPTMEEFDDPLQYIRKIYPKAVQFGICKIKPPPDWTPPFSVNMDEFTFTPRVQKINELEATTRIRMNFMVHITKFWEIQGTPLDIPVFDGKQVDLYKLHHVFNSNEFKNGKFICDDRKWQLIADTMGLKSEDGQTWNDLGIKLKLCYERILHPYDIWKATNESKNAIKSRKPRKGRADTRTAMRYRSKVKPKLISNDCLICNICDQNELLKCSDCHLKYHPSCLQLSLDITSKETWRCADCVSDKLKEFSEEYGFEQAVKQYTLQDFQKMADDFKADYFNGTPQDISSEDLEKEFWRIVSTVGENVVVEYGADVLGTGFPTSKTNNAGEFAGYVKSGWNLNNLPVRLGSAFAHIKSDVSGMKSPWVYVGMCFSTFCWHNEDHWSYSISYLHRGATKTWYGVPGGKAAEFEQAMRNAAPELFDKAPDLLHRLVTLVNPNVLMKAKIPIHRMDQNPGEFIITFPRSYHAGFNQGFNFAEAVNFAPADWVPMGRQCVQNYSRINRVCVFSHDELVCEMAKEPETMDYHLALATYHDLLDVLIAEKKARCEAISLGIKSCERFEFETIADDQRQCDVCKTTLFLSGITCSHSKLSGSPEKFVCLKHFDQYMCKDCKIDPTKYILRYRYTLDELLDILKTLKDKLELYALKAKVISVKSFATKSSTKELRLLIRAVEQSLCPDAPIKQEQLVVEDSSARSSVSLRARKNNSQFQDVRFKFNVSEWKVIRKLDDPDSIHQVPFRDYQCTKNDIEELKTIYDKARCWESSALAVAYREVKVTDVRVMSLLDEAEAMPSIHFPCKTKLQNLLKEAAAWLEKVESAKIPSTDDWYLHEIPDLIWEGEKLPMHVNLVEEFKSFKAMTERWLTKCSNEFLLPGYEFKLIEVLIPRTLFQYTHLNEWSNVQCKLIRHSLPSHFQVLESTRLSLKEIKDFDKLMTAIEKTMDDSCLLVKRRRSENQCKLSTRSVFTSFCYCKEKDGDTFDSSFMIQCELCFELFHPRCVSAALSSDVSVGRRTINGSVVHPCFHEVVPKSSKYIGPCCIRSCRPAPERIEKLIEEVVEHKVIPIELHYIVTLTSRLSKAFNEWIEFKTSTEGKIFSEIKSPAPTFQDLLSTSLERVNIVRGLATLEDLAIKIAVLPLRSYGEKYNFSEFWSLYFSFKHLVISRDKCPVQKSLIIPLPIQSNTNSSAVIDAHIAENYQRSSTTRKRKQSSCSRVDPVKNPADDEQCFMFFKPAKVMRTI